MKEVTLEPDLEELVNSVSGRGSEIGFSTSINDLYISLKGSSENTHSKNAQEKPSSPKRDHSQLINSLSPSQLTIEVLTDMCNRVQKDTSFVVALKAYKQKPFESCFTGRELVKWIVANYPHKSEREAEEIAQLLLRHSLIECIAGRKKSNFNEEYLFRFTGENGKQPMDYIIDVKLTKLAEAIKNPRNGVRIADRKYRFKTYPRCFIGYELVNWILLSKRAPDREQAVALCNQLLEHKIIRHVCGDTVFRDGYLLYQFCQ